MRVVTNQQMRELEAHAVAAGATWAGLMEAAGRGVAVEILRRLGPVQNGRVLVLVGPGNNGGDGLVVARLLHAAGSAVTLYLWQRVYTPEDRVWYACRERGIAELQAATDPEGAQLVALVRQCHLVVDALLGMGASRAISDDLALIIRTVNTNRIKPSLVVAIDVPTGVSSAHGALLGAAIVADVTVATGLPKRGVLLFPGRALVGELALAPLSLLESDEEVCMSDIIDAETMRLLLPLRPLDAHKGTFGRVVVVAGSLFYPGAATLATAGAARVGVGLVTLATGRSVLGASSRGSEVTLLPLPEADWGTIGPEAATEIFKYLERYDALVLGPGLGQEESTKLFLQRVLGLEQLKARSRVGFLAHSDEPKPTEDVLISPPTLPPTVIDADGLNLLAQIEHWAEHLPAGRCVFTPHPGEMKRLLGVEQLDPDSVQVAVDAAARWGQVVVLKSATTVVAAPDGQSAIYPGANPALATAGTGDVLAGVIGGLLAQGLAPFDAARLGVYLHGAAGALVRDEIGDAGALASDLLLRLPRAIAQLKGV